MVGGTAAPRRRPWLVGVAALIVAFAVLAGVRVLRSRAVAQPNILFIVIDSLRADRVGAVGGQQSLTPFIDQLASDSIVYQRAYAPSSWTIPVVASLFTGQYPSEHGVTNFFVALKDRTTLAETLAKAGYATSGVTANSAIQARFGFDRGFERFELVGEPTMKNLKSDGSLINRKALDLVDAVAGTHPHFLYLHYMDVHMPYRTHPGVTPPRDAALAHSDEELASSMIWYRWNFTANEVWRLEDLYDGEVEHLDAQLRDLFAGLEKRGFLKDALVIVTADHGEQFGRHGLYGHGASLNETLIHVPLIVKTPDGTTGRVTSPVQLGGLPAFILQTAGAPRPPSMHFDPLPTADSAAPPAHDAWIRSELVQSGHRDYWKHKQALVLGRYKLLVAPDGKEVMYDLSRDPYERRPLPSVNATLHETLATQLAAAQEHRLADQEPAPVTPDAATLERLRAAGYLN